MSVRETICRSSVCTNRRCVLLPDFGRCIAVLTKVWSQSAYLLVSTWALRGKFFRVANTELKNRRVFDAIAVYKSVKAQVTIQRASVLCSQNAFETTSDSRYMDNQSASDALVLLERTKSPDLFVGAGLLWPILVAQRLSVIVYPVVVQDEFSMAQGLSIIRFKSNRAATVEKKMKMVFKSEKVEMDP